MKPSCAIVLIVAACKFPGLDVIPDGSTNAAPPTTRLIAPLSGSIVTQQRPTLHWSLAPGDNISGVDLCADRACTTPRAMTVQMASDGLSGAPSAALPVGWTFWRVRATGPNGGVTTATWQLWVGHRSASSPADTAGGTMLDINGDGFADFVAVARACNETAGSGAAHVYLGAASPSWIGTKPAGRIDLPPPYAGAAFGAEAVALGDVNGDGFGDFVVVGEFNSAATVYIYLGGPTPNAADWNGSGTTRIDLPSHINFSSIAPLGDFNGDGYADFVVGEFPYARVYLGSPAPSVGDWAMENLMSFSPPGRAVYAAAGADINGDGYGDLVTTSVQGNDVYFGGPAAGPGDPPIALANPDTATGISPSPAGLGDLDGDGYSEFIITTTDGTATGAFHLYRGSAAPTADAWDAASTSQRIELTNPPGATTTFVAPLGGAGDVDGDGDGDFVLGAPDYQTGNDAAYLFSGSAMPSASTWNGTTATHRIDLASPDPAGALFGHSTASLGDVNGDGYADFGVSTANNGTASEIDVYLGSSGASATSWNGAGAPQRIAIPSPEAASCFGFRTN